MLYFSFIQLGPFIIEVGPAGHVAESLPENSPETTSGLPVRAESHHKAQIYEIASGLEASGHPVVWVIGKILDEEASGDVEICFPDGFEGRVVNSGQGMLIKGWAPQLLILEHGAVGGFMTHCGWNSTLEGVSAGVPMITWPLSAEQFYNEKLVSEVLRIGLRVGSEEWASWNMERKTVVGREKERLEADGGWLYGGGDEVAGERAGGGGEEGSGRRGHFLL